MLYSIDPSLTVLALLAYLFSGLLIGATTGYAGSLLVRDQPRKIPRSSFLGAFGFMAGELGALLLPGAKTTTYTMRGGQLVASTVDYPHPERIAVALAILLPLAYQLLRLQVAPPTSSSS